MAIEPLFFKGGIVFFVMSNETKVLNKGCIGLGMLDEIPFLESEEIEIKPNTTIILYTDGVVELENENEEQYETERLTKVVKSFHPLSMEDLNGIIFGNPHIVWQTRCR